MIRSNRPDTGPTDRPARQSLKTAPAVQALGVDPDWTAGCAQTHLDIMRQAEPDDLPALAASYIWSAHPEPVLGWVMAQRTIDLGSAVAIFQRGHAERFNYIHKRAVPYAFRATTRLLDNICLRLNCGFYLPRPGGVAVDAARLANWIEVQRADRATGACGRWVLDDTILSSLVPCADLPDDALDDAPLPSPVPARAVPSRPAWKNWRSWLTAPARPEEILTRE